MNKSNAFEDTLLSLALSLSLSLLRFPIRTKNWEKERRKKRDRKQHETGKNDANGGISGKKRKWKARMVGFEEVVHNDRHTKSHDRRRFSCDR